MPAKRKNGNNSLGQRRHAVIKETCSPEEKKFCVLIAEGISIPKAGREAFAYTNDDAAYKALNRPRVRKLLALLQERAQEKFLEKQAERIALNLDMADERIKEILSAPRLNEEKMAIMVQLGRTKAGVDLIRESGIMGPAKLPAVPTSEAGSQPGVPADVPTPAVTPPQPLPASDLAILKAADLCYKRKGGYSAPAPTATSQAIVQIVQQHQNERVYESRWVREQEGIVGSDCESVEHQLGLGSHAPAGIHTRSTEASEVSLGPED